MKILSVILARGGSKGIPSKNIVELNGKPLISYTIEASLQSNVDETWVSTDSSEIASVSSTYGASVIDRPSEISTDTSQSEEALLHAAHDSEFDVVVFIQPTSPLIKSEDINKGLKMMDKYDSVFSVTKEHWIPRWTMDVKPFEWEINNRPMRQDKPETYIENGAFYITKRKNLLESKLRYSGKIGVVEMPLSRSFQIDTLDDLNLINTIIRGNE
jgi:CMP-N-acetylneuraminic acid synthetase